MGLPEVALGLVPGAGGTVRLPRLVGAELALTMISSGKPITAQEALEAGLIDAIAQGDLVQEACDLAAAGVDLRPTLAKPVIGKSDATRFDRIASDMRHKARGQVSVTAAIDALERGLTLPATEALAAERATFLSLKTSEQARALRHIFFAERAALSDPRTKATPRPIARIGVIGGGTMGAGIASLCLMRGLTVTLIERDASSLDAGSARVRSTLESSAKRGLLPDLDATFARFDAATDDSALADVDLVIEAVFEEEAGVSQARCRDAP